MSNFKFGDKAYAPDGKECVFIKDKEGIAIVVFKDDSEFFRRVNPEFLIRDGVDINIKKENQKFHESGKLHTIDKKQARKYVDAHIFFGFIIDTFNSIINRINEIEDVINQK